MSMDIMYTPRPNIKSILNASNSNMTLFMNHVCTALEDAKKYSVADLEELEDSMKAACDDPGIRRYQSDRQESFQSTINTLSCCRNAWINLAAGDPACVGSLICALPYLDLDKQYDRYVTALLTEGIALLQFEGNPDLSLA